MKRSGFSTNGLRHVGGAQVKPQLAGDVQPFLKAFRVAPSLEAPDTAARRMPSAWSRRVAGSVATAAGQMLRAKSSNSTRMGSMLARTKSAKRMVGDVSIAIRSALARRRKLCNGGRLDEHIRLFGRLQMHCYLARKGSRMRPVSCPSAARTAVRPWQSKLFLGVKLDSITQTLPRSQCPHWIWPRHRKAHRRDRSDRGTEAQT